MYNFVFQLSFSHGQIFSLFQEVTWAILHVEDGHALYLTFPVPFFYSCGLVKIVCKCPKTWPEIRPERQMTENTRKFGPALSVLCFSRTKV